MILLRPSAPCPSVPQTRIMLSINRLFARLCFQNFVPFLCTQITKRRRRLQETLIALCLTASPAASDAFQPRGGEKGRDIARFACERRNSLIEVYWGRRGIQQWEKTAFTCAGIDGRAAFTTVSPSPPRPVLGDGRGLIPAAAAAKNYKSTPLGPAPRLLRRRVSSWRKK